MSQKVNKLRCLIPSISDNTIDFRKKSLRLFDELKGDLTVMNISRSDDCAKNKSIVVALSMDRISKLFFSFAFDVVAAFRISFTYFSFFQLHFLF